MAYAHNSGGACITSRTYTTSDALGYIAQKVYANGNMKKDRNKGISSITCNTLNLPSRIEYENGSRATYLYSADGTKLQVKYETSYARLLASGPPSGSASTAIADIHTIDYVGNKIYEDGALFAESTNSGVQPYKYNGKELDRMHGLDWYDHGARHNDAAIGRWHVMDPLCEKYYDVSPYAYCHNNPIMLIDFDGKDDYFDAFGKFLFNKGNGGAIYIRLGENILLCKGLICENSQICKWLQML